MAQPTTVKCDHCAKDSWTAYNAVTNGKMAIVCADCKVSL